MEYIKQANVKYSYSRPKKDITGMKFNQLEVLEWIGFKEVGTQKKRRSVYRCKCSCGNECEVVQSDMTSGNVKSCGCRLKNNIGSYKGKNYGSISSIMNNYKQSARKNKRAFSISRERFIELVTSNCYYCDSPPSTKRKPWNKKDDFFLYNGIDRIDNTRGYEEGNIVACCTTCNFLKKDTTREEFLNIIKRIYEWRIQLS